MSVLDGIMGFDIILSFYMLYLLWNGLRKLHKAYVSIGQRAPKQLNTISLDNREGRETKMLCELVKKQTILLFGFETDQ